MTVFEQASRFAPTGYSVGRPDTILTPKIAGAYAAEAKLANHNIAAKRLSPHYANAQGRVCNEPRTGALISKTLLECVVCHFLFRASMQRPSFQYMNVPQLPGRLAEAIRGCAGTERRALRVFPLGPAW